MKSELPSPRLLIHADMHTLLKSLFLRSEGKHLALEYTHTLGSRGGDGERKAKHKITCYSSFQYINKDF